MQPATESVPVNFSGHLDSAQSRLREGGSTEELDRSDWPVAMSVKKYLEYELLSEGTVPFGQCHSLAEGPRLFKRTNSSLACVLGSCLHFLHGLPSVMNFYLEVYVQLVSSTLLWGAVFIPVT